VYKLLFPSSSTPKSCLGGKNPSKGKGGASEQNPCTKSSPTEKPSVRKREKLFPITGGRHWEARCTPRKKSIHHGTRRKGEKRAARIQTLQAGSPRPGWSPGERGDQGVQKKKASKKVLWVTRPYYLLPEKLAHVKGERESSRFARKEGKV